MLSPERRALLLLLALAIAGQGVRHLAARAGEPPGQVQLLPGSLPGSPTAHRDSSMRQARPLAAGERIDADAADAAELARLPRVGLSLAKIIVADRAERGAFGSLEALDRVPGVGPGLLRSVGPHLTFSGVASPGTTAASSAGVGTTFAPTPHGDVAAARVTAERTAVNLNRATVVELQALPGIGPSLARRIVADREARGPFATVAALDRVPGVGPAIVARLASLAAAP